MLITCSRSASLLKRVTLPDTPSSVVGYFKQQNDTCELRLAKRRSLRTNEVHVPLAQILRFISRCPSEFVLKDSEMKLEIAELVLSDPHLFIQGDQGPE